VTAGQFALPVAFDLAGVLLFAVTGAWSAMARGYDVMGVFVLAFVTGTGGGLLRDGVFLKRVPVVLTDWRYLGAVVVGGLIGVAIGSQARRLMLVFAMVDALGLGAYAVVGAQQSIAAGLPALAAVIVGLTNAVGGGLLRDVLVREEPLLFRPSQLYGVTALVGCGVFLGLVVQLRVAAPTAALAAIGVTFVLRMLSIRFNWQTAPIGRRGLPAGGSPPDAKQ